MAADGLFLVGDRRVLELAVDRHVGVVGVFLADLRLLHLGQQVTGAGAEARALFLRLVGLHLTLQALHQAVAQIVEMVMLAAQRAREISAGSQLTIDRDNDKNPVVALREIADVN